MLYEYFVARYGLDLSAAGFNERWISAWWRGSNVSYIYNVNELIQA